MVDNGVVDKYGRTSDPDIFAVCDCSRHPDPEHAGLQRLESVPNASEQARVAAEVIIGSPRPYTTVPLVLVGPVRHEAAVGWVLRLTRRRGHLRIDRRGPAVHCLLH